MVQAWRQEADVPRDDGELSRVRFGGKPGHACRRVSQSDRGHLGTELHLRTDNIASLEQLVDLRELLAVFVPLLRGHHLNTVIRNTCFILPDRSMYSLSLAWRVPATFGHPRKGRRSRVSYSPRAST